MAPTMQAPIAAGRWPAPRRSRLPIERTSIRTPCGLGMIVRNR